MSAGPSDRPESYTAVGGEGTSSWTGPPQSEPPEARNRRTTRERALIAVLAILLLGCAIGGSALAGYRVGKFGLNDREQAYLTQMLTLAQNEPQGIQIVFESSDPEIRLWAAQSMAIASEAEVTAGAMLELDGTDTTHMFASDYEPGTEPPPWGDPQDEMAFARSCQWWGSELAQMNAPDQVADFSPRMRGLADVFWNSGVELERKCGEIAAGIGTPSEGTAGTGGPAEGDPGD